jgi:hypothetical protein
MTLPESGWKGYGRPDHPYSKPQTDAVAMHEWHAEVAEYRLRHCGIKPELLAYLRGIGESVR